MFYVADTHTLIWYILDKLPKEMDEIFKKAESGEYIIFIPSIVLAEVLYLVRKKKIRLNYAELLRKIELGRNFVDVAFNFQILKIMIDIELDELHDLIIVATTKLFNAQLLTKDKKVREANVVSTIWARH